jgi:ABC-type sugar transport system permease subunit
MLIGFLVFVLGPAIYAVILTFHNYDILTPARFSGIENYIKLFNDPRLPQICWL